MVKADPSRNYYLDLGIAATADENEVRKAFRALALKWHPDRNPGREAEFVAKFQQIQAAHEILSDPVQRAKYDADRKKYRNINIPTQNPNTPRARPPPPRYGHTTTTPSGSYYRPPPPKPTPSRPPPPQQHHSTYASGADRFTSKNFRAPPTAQRQDARPKDAEARANVFTAWQKMKQTRPEEARTAHAGNPNNPNGVPFGRSQSTRNPSRKGFDPLNPGADEGQARSSYRSHYERPAPSPPQTADPMRDTGGDEVPFSEANRVRTPYFSTKSGERTSMFEGIGRSASVRNSPTHSHRPTLSTDAGSFSDGGHSRGQRNSYAGKPANPFPQMYSSSSDEESEAEVFRTKHQRPPPPPPGPPHNQQSSWGQKIFGAAEQKADGSRKSDTTPHNFKSRSEESINMKFSPSAWHGKFEGTPDYLTANMQRSNTNKGRTSPTRGRQPYGGENPFTPKVTVPPPATNPWAQFQQPTQIPTGPPPPPPPGPPPSNTRNPFQTENSPAQPQHAMKFSPQAWANTFKEPGLFQPTAKETSPRRGSEPAKRPGGKAQRKASQNTRAGIENQPGKSKAKHQAFAEEAEGDIDPMDIDTNTPPVEKTNTSASRSRAVPSPSQGKKGAGTVPNGTTTTPASAAPSRPPPAASAAKAPTTGLNGLAGLSSVEPFLPTANGGLTGLNDLKDTLPFKSQASGAHPTKPNTAQKLKIPTVPQAPQPPAKLDQVSAEQYFAHMEHYVHKFREYNKNMTAHFSSRCSELDNLDDSFIRNRGETTKKLGFPSYLHKMKEDEKVMESWKIGQELHIQAMEKCEEIRNKTIKLVNKLLDRVKRSATTTSDMEQEKNFRTGKYDKFIRVHLPVRAGFKMPPRVPPASAQPPKDLPKPRAGKKRKLKHPKEPVLG